MLFANEDFCKKSWISVYAQTSMKPTPAQIVIAILLVALNSSVTFSQRQIGSGDFKFEVKHRVNAHGDEFNALAQSSDGQRLFTGTEKGDIIVWNVATNRLERTLHQPSAIHLVAALSDPREVIAAGSNHLKPQNALVRKWNVENGTFVDLAGIDTNSFVTGLAADPDAGLIAATGEDGTVVVWDSRTHQQLAKWKVNGVPIAVALLARNVYVATLDQKPSDTPSREGAIVKLNLDDQNQQPTDFLRIAGRMWISLRVSPDRRLLSATYQAGYDEGNTVVIDPVSKAEVGSFDASDSAWIDASRLLLFNWLDPTEIVQFVAGAAPKSIRKFDRMESDTPGRAFELTGQVTSADGSKAWASYSKGPGLLEFDLTANKIKTLITGPSGAYAVSVVTQDGQSGELLTGGADGYVRLWNLADISLLKEYKVAKPGYYVGEAHLLAGARRAVVRLSQMREAPDVTEPSEVVLLDLETGQQKKLFYLYSWRARVAVVDNRIIYPEGNRIKITSIDGSESQRELVVNGFIGVTAVSANGRWFAVIDDTKRLTVFDLTTGRKKTIPIKSDDPGPLVVTDDGQHVYHIANEGSLTHWNINTGKATSKFLSRIREMHTRVGFMTLANNDRWLITAGNHHDVGIFDRATSRLVFYMQTGGAAFYVEKVWLNGKRMILTTDTGVMYNGILQ